MMSYRRISFEGAANEQQRDVAGGDAGEGDVRALALEALNYDNDERFDHRFRQSVKGVRLGGQPRTGLQLRTRRPPKYDEQKQGTRRANLGASSEVRR